MQNVLISLTRNVKTQMKNLIIKREKSDLPVFFSTYWEPDQFKIGLELGCLKRTVRVCHAKSVFVHPSLNDGQ